MRRKRSNKQMTSKQCASCRVDKETSDYYRHRSDGIALRSVCKACCAEQRKLWREQNPEKHQRHMASWSQSDKYREYSKTRNRKEESKRSKWGGNHERAIIRDGERCLVCKMTRQQHYSAFGRDITVDHINGRISDDLGNLQTLCLKCHGKKDIKKRWRIIQ